MIEHLFWLLAGVKCVLGAIVSKSLKKPLASSYAYYREGIV